MLSLFQWIKYSQLREGDIESICAGFIFIFWFHIMTTTCNSITAMMTLYTPNSGYEHPAGGCFTNVSRALQMNLAKIYNARNHIYSEDIKLKLCTCAQSMALGTRTKFQLDILIRSTISAIHKFREIIFGSSRNVSETPPWCNCPHRSEYDKPERKTPHASIPMI